MYFAVERQDFVYVFGRRKCCGCLRYNVTSALEISSVKVNATFLVQVVSRLSKPVHVNTYMKGA